jgi:hypothetical protein
MKSRWFRFSLRTLLLLITALCVWLGIQINAARRQRDAVAAMIKAGGTVVYDYQVAPARNTSGFPRGLRMPYSIDTDKLPPGNSSLRSLFGDDCFRTVIAVIVPEPNPALQKTTVDQLAELGKLKEFILFSPGADLHDNDLAALAELGQLETLQVMRARINGSVLRWLRNPARLKELFLCDTDVDDTAMEHIGRMTALERLMLDGTHITDAGLARLHGLKRLEFLSLGKTQVTDAGVSELRAALPNANIVWP